MDLTDYHAKYIAFDLTRRFPPDSAERLAGAVVGALVDLNPHRLEREIMESDRQIRDVRRTATAAVTLEEKLAGQRQVKALEAQRSQKRRSLFDAQGEVDRQREALIGAIGGKLAQSTNLDTLFTVRWFLA